MTLPLVSIITVVRNGAKSLADTLESVSYQENINIEHILIDGASTDGTLDIIKKYGSAQPVIWVSEPDCGIYDAMNKGISLARGEWVLFLGADDILADKNVLEDVFLKKDVKEFSAIFGRSSYTSGQQCKPKLDWRTLIFNTVHHQAAFYRRSLFKSFCYKTDMPVIADYELNLLLYLKRNPVLIINRKIAVSGCEGISYRASQFLNILDAFKIRRAYIGLFANLFFLLLGLSDFMFVKLRALCRSG